MHIFEFHITGKDLNNPEIDDLTVASRLFRCSNQLQGILKEIALVGKAVIKQEGVKKGTQIIEALSSSPFIVANDFNFRCVPLFSSIISKQDTVEIIGSDSLFYGRLKKILTAFTLPEVEFKNQSSSRFFFYWIREGKPGEVKLLYSELRDLLNLKKKNYKSFDHYKRVLSTIKGDLEKYGYNMMFSKYPEGGLRASGALIHVKEK